ncbi:MAG: aldehyde dehydrogenase family protein [Spirochaetales bacterium]|nr:aldehyde dehydrogenase family protein [Spirochaetales bacterium]
MEYLIQKHRQFSRENRNKSPLYRIERLERLETAIRAHRHSLIEALKADMKKPDMEIYSAEFGLVLHELEYAKKHLAHWMKRKRVARGGYVLPSPFGAALIIGTWNYPVQLTLVPVVAAIAAGNGITVKPSELTPETAQALKVCIESAFPPDDIAVLTGGPDVAATLVDSGYDKVFFTGSSRIGAIIAETAARHHCSVTLELGGKSPVIVGTDCKLDFAAKRIVWGKFLNAGQTCIAPDYVLAPRATVKALVREMQSALTEFYTDTPRESPDYARIVNEAHFDRLSQLIDAEGIDAHRDRSECYISPVIVECREDSTLMKDEIFGPILPVLSYESEDEIAAIVGRHKNPLAVYVFSKNKQFTERILDGLEYGGAAVNDVISQATDPRIPFGGRGASGMGSYHGRYGFEAFSHLKGIVYKRQGAAGSMAFPPYRPLPEWVRRLIFRI